MSRVLPYNAKQWEIPLLLDGRKTVTRSLIKPQPHMRLCYAFAGYGHGKWHYPDKDAWKYWGEKFKRPDNMENDELERTWVPPYHTDDILYVRETWQCWRAHRYEASADIRFKAGGEGVRLEFANGNTDSIDRCDYDAFVNKWFSHNGEWHPSIHMPKEAARIWLKVTDVRVERLQDITEEGAIKEGLYKGWKIPTLPKSTPAMTARQAFMWIWDPTIKESDLDRYGWITNPWVWVIEFERCEKPGGEA